MPRRPRMLMLQKSGLYRCVDTLHNGKVATPAEGKTRML
jgi:hypothetical protein